MSDTLCHACSKPVTPSREAHFHRWINGTLVCFHADCYQRYYAQIRQAGRQETMGERKSGAQDPHVGPDCMLLYYQEGDEQHRKAAERIHWLEQEVERLREIVSGLPWTEKEIVTAENEALKMRVAILESCEARLNRLVEQLEIELNKQRGDHPFRTAIAEIVKEAREDGDE